MASQLVARLGLTGLVRAQPLASSLLLTSSTFTPSSFTPSIRQLCQKAAAKEAPPAPKSSTVTTWVMGVGLGLAGVFSYTLFSSDMPKTPAVTSSASTPAVKKDYGAVKAAIGNLLDVENYDDGSYGPVLVRLAWHCAGTYDKNLKNGGSNGATMRFHPECAHGANAGLDVARKVLEPVKAKFPWISNADLWTLAGCTAIEEMGGPHIPWRAGRVDKPDGSHCPVDGRLPDADKGAPHIREVFNRMGFDDQEIVALSGAHTLGRCHTTRSGFEGPWTNAPTTFSNLYFQELLNQKWTKKKWTGPVQYEDKSKQLMMLPTDMALIWDRNFKKHVQTYAKDQDKFFADFAKAFQKLMELGTGLPADAPTI